MIIKMKVLFLLLLAPSILRAMESNQAPNERLHKPAQNALSVLLAQDVDPATLPFDWGPPTRALAHPTPQQNAQTSQQFIYLLKLLATTECTTPEDLKKINIDSFSGSLIEPYSDQLEKCEPYLRSLGRP